MASNCSQFWRQRLQNIKNFHGNDFIIPHMEPLMWRLELFTAKLLMYWSHWHENCDNIGAIDAKIMTFLTRNIRTFQHLEDWKTDFEKQDQNLIIACGKFFFSVELALSRTFSYYISVPHFVLQKSIIGSLPLSRREQKYTEYQNKYYNISKVLQTWQVPFNLNLIWISEASCRGQFDSFLEASWILLGNFWLHFKEWQNVFEVYSYRLITLIFAKLSPSSIPS